MKNLKEGKRKIMKNLKEGKIITNQKPPAKRLKPKIGWCGQNPKP